MIKKIFALTVAASVLLPILNTAGTAWAAIAEVSHDANGAVTINLANGFPLWYEDVSGGGGDRLQPCLGTNPDGQGPKDQNCLVPADTTYDGINPISFPTNFPSEFFYYRATARIENVGPTGAGRVDFLAGLEGSFDSGIPSDGDQITFLIIDLAAFNEGDLTANSTYNVTHPFGLAFSFTTDSSGAASRVKIQDGGATPGDFVSLLPAANTGFSRFINVTSPVPGYVGDPLASQVLENGGILTITGPNIGGQGINIVSTNLFNVAGKISPNNPPVFTSISVSPANATVVVGATRQFTAVALDQFGNPMIPQPAIEWRTDNNNIASISAAGLATGVDLGAVTITARSGNISSTTNLAAVNTPVCETTADADLDEIISNLEILNHIRAWKAGDVPNLEILNAIRFWKAGTGC